MKNISFVLSTASRIFAYLFLVLFLANCQTYINTQLAKQKKNTPDYDLENSQKQTFGSENISEEDLTEEQIKENYYAKLDRIDEWNMLAKMGFIYYEGKKKKAVNASLDWGLTPERSDVVLSGPLGFGRVNIISDDNGAKLITSRGEVITAENPEQLFFQQTGVNIPWSYLVWWIRGLPVPDLEHKKALFKDSPKIKRMQQAGWTIEYLDHETPLLEIGKSQQEANASMPVKLKFKKDSMSAKIIIRDWGLVN